MRSRSLACALSVLLLAAACTSSRPAARGAATPPETTAPSPPPPPPPPAYRAAEPINSRFEGLTTFRGNATRSYYGEGPVPSDPEILWRFPRRGGMCAPSREGGRTRIWCGTGWTGQPNVVETTQGRTEVRFGAYDRAIHFLDAATGKEVRAPFRTGDIIKGTVTTDPDGFPLVYSGSRDGSYRVLALDRGRKPVEVYRLRATTAPRVVWNDDWDSSALIVNDHLLEGGENSWFYVVKLNRRMRGGRVTVRPRIRALFPGYDRALFRAVGDRNVSIENSPAYRDGVVYFANSGGLVQGWDVSDVLRGGRRYERVFRFWTGDDTDASIVIDDEGYLYVASEYERFLPRARSLGQLFKLDPRKPRSPVVWSREARAGDRTRGGIWATPAIWGPNLYVTTNGGGLRAYRRSSGRLLWDVRLPGPTWSSPAIVEPGVLVVGDCAGVLHAYDVRGDRPVELWRVKLGGCIESTPAVWKGRVYVGTRSGAMFGVGDR